MSRTENTTATAQSIESELVERVGETRYDRYFRDAVSVAPDGQSVTVRVRSPFYADWLDKRFGESLRESLRALTGAESASVRWEVRPEATPVRDEDGAEAEAAGLGPAPSARRPSTPVPGRGRGGHRLRGRLEDFVVGESNRLAYDAARRICEPGDDAGDGFRLLFVHGSCGVGKTHLLQGIANAYRSANPDARIWYTTGESFTNEYVESVRSGGPQKFRSRVRALDLLCIDDVHFVAGKKATKSEVLHTLDALDLSGGRVVLASDAHPARIDELGERLVSRCMSGVLARIDEPDRWLRLRLIGTFASRLALTLDEEAVEAIERRAGPSIRDLQGVLSRVDAVRRSSASRAGGTIDGAFVRSALADAARPRRPIRCEDILGVICDELLIERSEVLGRGRHKRIVLARSLAAYLAKELTSQSYPEIARSLGRPNHSTVVTAYQRVERQMREGETCDCGPVFEGLTIAALCDRLRDSVLRRSTAV